MQEHVSDAYAFLVVVCLPLVAWVVSRPPVWRRVRARLGPVAWRLWRALVQAEEPDEEALRRWAAVRLAGLRGHLERVRLLVLDDEHMTATRQVGNRMAHERLVRDVREAELALMAFGPLEPAAAPVAVLPLAQTRLVYSPPPARPVVELIEFGPRGRWI
jgi:hypothetical protein